MVGDDRYLEGHGPDEIRVKGTRVGLEQILSAYLDGALPEQIALEYPTVTLEQVHGVIAWYLRSREEAGEYLRRWRDFARQQRAQQDAGPTPAVVQRLRRLVEERVAG